MSAAITFAQPVEHSVNGRDFAVSVATVNDSVVARVLYDYDLDEYRVQMRAPQAKWTKPMPRKRVTAFIRYNAKRLAAKKA